MHSWGRGRGRDLLRALVWLLLGSTLPPPPTHTVSSALGSFSLGLTVWTLFYFVYLLCFSPSRYPESKDLVSCSQCLEQADLLIPSVDALNE